MGIPPLMPLGDFRAVCVTEIFIINRETKEIIYSIIVLRCVCLQRMKFVLVYG